MMNISIPKELESLIQKQIEIGHFENVNDVINTALLNYFYPTNEDLADINKIRKFVEPRLKALEEGTAQFVDADDVFDELEKKFF